MRRVAATFICIAAFMSIMYTGSAGAADEDTQASVYLVFDAETGEFITVDDPSVTSQHAAQQDQEAIESVVETADGATAADADAVPATWIIVAGVAVLLLGGGFLLQRNRQQVS